MSAGPFGRLLIANRGEIAIRVARAARELGIVPLGIYSEADADALHVRAMNESACVGPGPAAQSYLNSAAIVAAAKTLRADAVHPGYGFLSERASFAQAVIDAGLRFVGPPPAAMAAIGNKIEAKQLARAHGVPVVPGYDGADQSVQTLAEQAREIGFPILVKASAGGGGRGMRVVAEAAEFEAALAAAKREAMAAFGDDAVLLEKYLARPRHIEFQILADAHGTVVHVGERECSIQRRHQKLIEEAPSPALDPALRARMGAAAVAAARAAGYVNAGTVEFMLDEEGNFYFLEVNARLQVEHPVTELVYGIDLVHWQLRVAAGEVLALQQDALVPRGSAIEARINAEDPATMLPQTGRIERWSFPAVAGLRVDSGVEAGSDVGVFYDSMLAKAIAWGPDRATAVGRLDAALSGATIAGLATNVPLLLAIVRDDDFLRGATTTRFMEERIDPARFVQETPEEAILLAAFASAANGRGWRIGGVGMPVALRFGKRDIRLVAEAVDFEGGLRLRGDLCAAAAVRMRGEEITVRLHGAARALLSGSVIFEGAGRGTVVYGGRAFAFADIAPPSAQGEHAAADTASGAVVSPMPGKIARVEVRVGEAVQERALLVVLEAMKMEHRIEAPLAGTITELFVEPGELVAAGATLVQIGA